MGEHYFTAEPGSPTRSKQIEFTAGGGAYTVTTGGGVFSGDRLDTGTSVLLRKAPLPTADTTGALLDLGCGYGPIAVVLADRARHARVWAVDVNARARELAAANAERLGLGERLRVAAPDEVPDDQTFTEIWSNPPIRIGKPELHALLRRWLPRLAPDGRAWLVVARHLGADSLAAWLTGEGWAVQRQASAAGYRVLKVTRPEPA